MPVEDWIEKWAEIQTKEIERIERQHGERMDKLEKSIEAVNVKLDNLTDLITKRNERHAIDIAVIKTKMALYAAAAGLLAGGFVSWFIGFFSK